MISFIVGSSGIGTKRSLLLYRETLGGSTLGEDFEVTEVFFDTTLKVTNFRMRKVTGNPRVSEGASIDIISIDYMKEVALTFF